MKCLLISDLIKFVLISVVAASLPACGNNGGDAVVVEPVKTFTPIIEGDDPLFDLQWHLNNTQQFIGLTAGEDINVTPVWEAGFTGEGVLVVLVDDGLEIGHEDLLHNIASGKSWDFRDHDTNPTPVPFMGNSHGTSVAGLIAARDMNSLGGRGVAPRASLAAYNLIWNEFSTSSEVYEAMTRNAAEVAVSNNSWGDTNSALGEAISAPDLLWHQGVEYGVTHGRGGKGTIYVWAAGNGGEFGIGNTNYEFHKNNRHVITVCAVDGHGVKASYSEVGASLWLCAPGGDGVGLVTTDATGIDGFNTGSVPGEDIEDINYTGRFAGTSAATPIVSGVVALMLEANPELGWRDVRLILAETARKNDTGDSDWLATVPASGQPTYHINHKYGFGVVDAAAAVTRAQSWTNVGAQVIEEVSENTSGLAIPDNDNAGVTRNLNFSTDLIVEYIEVEVNTDHAYSGDLEIVLTAPSGTQSVLAERHDCIDESTMMTRFVNCVGGYNPWTFGSVRHIGESSQGVWTLKVADKSNINSSQAYNLNSWKLRVVGRTP